jgi:hypothetical protein
VATARADGSSVVVLVKPGQGAKLSGPSWQGGTVLYTEQNTAGTHFVRQAQTVGQTDHSDGELGTFANAETGDWKQVADTSNPASVQDRSLYGIDSTLVFQAPGSKGPELWIHRQDHNSRGGANPADKLIDGSWPALSADGALAFVGTGGGIEVVAAATLAKTNNATPTATKIEDGASSAAHLTWTPDGKSIAYSTPTGIMEVPDQPGATPTQLSAKPGVVSFLPPAADRIVPLSASSATDLVGASITVSQHRWLTETGSTAEPAGGGPHGPSAMSVTIVAADDPATAQKELSWAGLYGPTLLTTGHGNLDPRLATEIRRVLGKAQIGSTLFPGVDTVNLVGAPGSIPADADTVIKGLGYTAVHVTSAPKPTADSTSAAPPVIAVVDPADTAALTEAKAEGARVMQLGDGKLAAADAAYLTGLDTGWQSEAGHIVAFGDKAFAAATALKLQHIATSAEALGTTHADYLAAIATSGTTNSLTVIPDGSPADLLLADLGSPQSGYQKYGTSVVAIDPAQGISPTLKALLDTQSVNVDELDVIDTTSKLPAGVVTQLGALISGPLDAQTIPNQTADNIAKTQRGGSSSHGA